MLFGYPYKRKYKCDDPFIIYHIGSEIKKYFKFKIVIIFLSVTDSQSY